MPYLCVIESEAKSLSELKQAAESLASESKLEFISFSTLQDLEKHKSNESEFVIDLMVICAEALVSVSLEKLQSIKDQYQTRIVLTSYEDTAKPMKGIEKWPIENLIYKPFDQPILQEHLKFALIKDSKVKVTAVHTFKDKLKIEKMRRFKFLALSDFSFKINTTSQFSFEKIYKFYHPLFESDKKQSVWARLVYQNSEEHEFVICNYSKILMTQLRKKILTAKEKVKKVNFEGMHKLQAGSKIQVGVQLVDEAEIEKLADFFRVRFPEIELQRIIYHQNQIPDKHSYNLNLVISDHKMSKDDLQKKFGTEALYFFLTQHQEVIEDETVQFYHQIDRFYLARMIKTYFPKTKDLDETHIDWITSDSDLLSSEMIEVYDFSEAAFCYDRPTILPKGNYQEFTLPIEDESEISVLKAHIHFVNENKSDQDMYPHQVVFLGIRDNWLKKIRKWMLEQHIDKKQKQG